MAKYRNKGASHQAIDGTDIGPGETFDGDDYRRDLLAFPDKFERLPDPEPVAPKVVPEPVTEPVADPEPDPELPGSDATDPDLKDVTADFPTAGENDMRVLRGKRGWHLFDEGDKEPINEKPLLKREVAPAIDAYLAD